MLEIQMSAVKSFTLKKFLLSDGILLVIWILILAKLVKILQKKSSARLIFTVVCLKHWEFTLFKLNTACLFCSSFFPPGLDHLQPAFLAVLWDAINTARASTYLTLWFLLVDPWCQWEIWRKLLLLFKMGSSFHALVCPVSAPTMFWCVLGEGGCGLKCLAGDVAGLMWI